MLDPALRFGQGFNMCHDGLAKKGGHSITLSPKLEMILDERPRHPSPFDATEYSGTLTHM